MKKIFNYLLVAFVACVGLATTACSDDEGGKGAPVITGVRLTDPEKADSLFTDAYAGNLICIVGQNLATAQKIYINGQDVPFELPYVTDTHIILPIPEKLELVATNPELPSEIRVVTKYGETSYAFHIKSPDGWITSIAVSGYPIDPGVVVRLEGANFYEVKRVYYTDVEPIDEDSIAKLPEGFVLPTPTVEFDIPDFRISEEYDTLVFTVPQRLADKGWFAVEMYANTAKTKVSRVPPSPQIWTISSDMPVTGEVVTLTGLYFIDVRSLSFGPYTLGPADLNVAEDFKSVEFVMPEIPSDLSSFGTLTIECAGGSLEVPFYEPKGILLDWDTVFNGFWWGANEFPGTLQIINDGDDFAYPHSHCCYGMKWWSDPTWWTNQGVWGLPLGAYAPTYNDEPIKNLEIRMEVLFIDFVNANFYFDCGQIKRDANGMLTDINGKQNYGHWSAYSFKLTDICPDPNAKWGDVISDGDQICFRFFVPGFLETGEQQEFYLDNIRLYRSDSLDIDYDTDED